MAALPDPTASPTYSLSYLTRASAPNTPQMTSYFLQLMTYKKSNLCVSADVSTTAQLLEIAEEVGPSIVMLKTHADIVKDWSDRTIKGLVEVARRHKFLLFEDRKFGDIGNTVQSQYSSGVHRIANWAHYVNAHIFPGPAIIEALKESAYSSLAAANSSISTSIFSSGPFMEDQRLTEQLNKDTQQLKNTYLASRRHRGRSNPSSPAGAPTDASASPASLAPTPRSPPIRALSAGYSGAGDSDDEDEEVRIRRESQILEGSEVVSVSTTITATTEYISPPATGTQSSFGAVFAREPRDDDDDSDEPQTPSGPIPNPPLARGLLLLAQMSSKDNLLDAPYTAACLAQARKHPDFVLGFIAQQALNSAPGDNFLVFTPGIQLPPPEADADANGASHTRAARLLARTGASSTLSAAGLSPAALAGPPAAGDALGQQYNTPRKAVLEAGCDVIIVGRGILRAADREAEAERYRRAGWAAYLERVKRGAQAL